MTTAEKIAAAETATTATVRAALAWADAFTAIDFDNPDAAALAKADAASEAFAKALAKADAVLTALTV